MGKSNGKCIVDSGFNVRFINLGRLKCLKYIVYDYVHMIFLGERIHRIFFKKLGFKGGL